MQVAPIKPNLKPPGTKRLKANFDIILSTSAFKSNLRRYTKGTVVGHWLERDGSMGRAARMLLATLYDKVTESLRRKRNENETKTKRKRNSLL